MTADIELNAERFFATRTGVCVYVTVRRQVFRVRFASADAQGVVVEGPNDGADEARAAAWAAVQKLGTALDPLFVKVARGTT